MSQFWGALGALLPLDHLGHYLKWGWFQINVSNLVVIILMVVAFVVALAVPFPGRRSRRGDKS